MLRVRLLFIMSILSPVNKYYHTRHSVNKYVTIQYLVYYIIAETICLHSSPVQSYEIMKYIVTSCCSIWLNPSFMVYDSLIGGKIYSVIQ